MPVVSTPTEPIPEELQPGATLPPVAPEETPEPFVEPVAPKVRTYTEPGQPVFEVPEEMFADPDVLFDFLSSRQAPDWAVATISGEYPELFTADAYLASGSERLDFWNVPKVEPAETVAPPDTGTVPRELVERDLETVSPEPEVILREEPPPDFTAVRQAWDNFLANSDVYKESATIVDVSKDINLYQDFFGENWQEWRDAIYRHGDVPAIVPPSVSAIIASQEEIAGQGGLVAAVEQGIPTETLLNAGYSVADIESVQNYVEDLQGRQRAEDILETMKDPNLPDSILVTLEAELITLYKSFSTEELEALDNPQASLALTERREYEARLEEAKIRAEELGIVIEEVFSELDIEGFFGEYTETVDGETVWKTGTGGEAQFIIDIRAIGKNDETTALLLQVFPGITNNEIREIFGELPLPTYDEWVAKREEGYTVELGPIDWKVNLPWTTTTQEDYERYIETVESMDLVSRALAAGFGQLAELVAGGARWLGADGIAEYLSAEAASYLRLTIPDMTPDELTWQDVYVGAFQALPTTLALVAPTLLTFGAVGVGAAAIGLSTTWQFITSAVVGGVVGAGMESALEAGATYDAALAKGMSPAEAHEAAQQTFNNNMKLLGITNVAELAVFFAPGLKAVKAAAAAGLIKTVTLASGQLVI